LQKRAPAHTDYSSMRAGGIGFVSQEQRNRHLNQHGVQSARIMS